MRDTKNLDANEILQLVFRYLTKISSLREYDDIIVVLADMGRVLTSSDRCSVWIVDEEKQQIWTKVAHGIDAIRLPINSGIVGSAITEGKRIIIDDVHSDNRFNADIDRQSGCVTKSMMVIPMTDYEGDVIGAFQVINHQGATTVFDVKDMELLMLASTYAAETLISARFTNEYKKEEVVKVADTKTIKILGAYGTKAKGFGTTSFFLNSKNVIDAGNLLATMNEKTIEIENIWLTHSHLDHISDIAYILDNYYSLRYKTLNILGLPQTIKILKKHFFNNLVWPDFSSITLSQSNKIALSYTEIELGKEYTINEDESIEAFKTDHTVPSCGYIYKKDGSSVLITADTYALDNIIEIIDSREDINSIIIECSFPTKMFALAKKSKHLTPELLFDNLKKLKRDDIKLYINHIKPTYIDKITKEIQEYSGKFEPIILKDEDIVNFSS